MKTSVRFTAILMMFAAVMLANMLIFASTAQAQFTHIVQQQSSEIDQCAPNADTSDLTKKIVDCMRGMIKKATNYILTGLSEYMVTTFGAMCVFAIIVFGMRMMMGETQLKGKTMSFILKLAFVSAYSYGMGGLSDSVFDILDWLVTLVTGGVSPWTQIDSFLGKLMGFGKGDGGSPRMLFQGLIGLIGIAAVSSTVGLTLFVAGVAAILDLLWFIFRIIMTYLTAYMVIGFLMCISPLVIPLALFTSQERYFRKWVDIMIANILTPVMLMAFLWLFLGIFDQLISDLFDILGGDDLRAYWKFNQPVMSWMTPSDPNFARHTSTAAGTDGFQGMQGGVSAVQSFISPIGHSGANLGTEFPAIDFGANNVGITQQLVYKLVEIWIFSSLFKSMITKIPNIASGIAGTYSSIKIEGGSFKQSMARIQNEAQQNMNYLAAGASIGIINKFTTKPRRRRQ